MIALLFLVMRVLLSPALGSDLGAAAAGRPDLAPEVRQICRRESWGCRRIGVHVGHVKRKAVEVFAAAARRTGVAKGCPEVAPREWGPRGPHGHVPAHALRHLPRCSPPWVLDLPAVSGYVAAKRLEVLERRYKLTTPGARGHAWRHGVSCTCKG